MGETIACEFQQLQDFAACKFTKVLTDILFTSVCWVFRFPAASFKWIYQQMCILKWNFCVFIIDRTLKSNFLSRGLNWDNIFYVENFWSALFSKNCAQVLSTSHITFLCVYSLLLWRKLMVETQYPNKHNYLHIF